MTELEGTFTRLSRGVGLRSDGTLVSYSDDYPRLEPLVGDDFVDLSAGQDYFCALRSDGEALCGGSRVR
jgi:hypothetical protein